MNDDLPRALEDHETVGEGGATEWRRPNRDGWLVSPEDDAWTDTVRHTYVDDDEPVPYPAHFMADHVPAVADLAGIVGGDAPILDPVTIEIWQLRAELVEMRHELALLQRRLAS